MYTKIISKIYIYTYVINEFIDGCEIRPNFFFSRHRSGKKRSMAGNTSIEGEYTDARIANCDWRDQRPSIIGMQRYAGLKADLISRSATCIASGNNSAWSTTRES